MQLNVSERHKKLQEFFKYKLGKEKGEKSKGI